MRDLFELSAKITSQKHRTFRRYLLTCNPFENMLTILLGQRGVGKTTLMIQYLMDRFQNFYSEKVLYVPMDHFVVGNRTMYEIAGDFEKLAGELICFDEIHKYPDWSKELKSISDSFPRLQVIASGSSALAIRKGSHDLSRRAVIQTLRPMSFREWLTVNQFDGFPVICLENLLLEHRTIGGQVAEQLRKHRTTVLNEFARYLQVGYYPYSLEYRQQPEIFHLILEQSVHATIENDLPALFPNLTGASILKIKQLLSTICGLVPFKPDMARLKRSLHIGDERTLKTYLKHLEDAGIIHSLHREGKSLNNLDKPEKLYLDNPNLITALAANIPDIGNLRETFFLSCFKKEEVAYSETGDFRIGKFLFEVGGKNKDFRQISGITDSYLALDGIEIGLGKKIPLWLFGFLY